MKLFIKNITIFFLLLCVSFGVIGIFNWWQLKKQPSLSGTSILIAGDSRMMTAIDPELIPQSRNIAQNSESYIITYHKLKFLLKQKNTIKKILLGFSYPSFSAYLDGIFKDDMATADIFSRIYPIMSPADFVGLKMDKVAYYRVWIQQMLVYPHIDHHQYMGGFVKLKYGLDKASLDGVINRHYFNKDSVNVGISPFAKIYLDSIIDLTSKNSIELILVNVPFQQKYLQRVPNNFKEYYNKVKLEMISRKIKILDYSEYPLDDKYFKDYNHLDLEGADYFTSRIKEEILN